MRSFAFSTALLVLTFLAASMELSAAAPQFKTNSTNGFDTKSDSTEMAPKRQRRAIAGLIVGIIVVIIVELAAYGIEYGISTSCVAGDTTMRKLDEETKTETSTAVRDLNRGDVVLGAAGGDLTPTYCKVETVGFFGNGSVYGNYTDHHYMLDNSTKEVHAHGQRGAASETDKYVVLLGPRDGEKDECLAGLDESTNLFTPLDTDFCGPNISLTFVQYRMLYRTILNTVRRTGGYWLNIGSYQPKVGLNATGDRVVLQWNDASPYLCESMLLCAESGSPDSEACADYEAVSKVFAENFLTPAALNETNTMLPNLGQPGVNGSASFAAFDDGSSNASVLTGNGFIAVIAATVAVLALGLVAVAVKYKRHRSRTVNHIATNDTFECSAPEGLGEEVPVDDGNSQRA